MKLNGWLVIFLLLTPLNSIAQDQDLINAKHLVVSRTSFEDAKVLLQKYLAQKPGNSEAHFLLGKVLYSFTQYELATTEAEKAISLNANQSDYHLLLGYCFSAQLDSVGFFKQMSLAPRIRAEFEQAIALNPKNIAAAAGLAEFFSQAPAIVGGNYEKALEQVKRISAFDAIEGRYVMATLYIDRKKLPEAENEYKAAIAADPKRSKSYVRLAMLYIAENKDADALPLFQRALEIDPDCLPAYLGIARSDLLKGEKFDEAERYFKKYLSRWPEDGDPTLANAHWRLGQLYEKQGKKELAIAEWNQATKLIPNYGPAMKSLKHISGH